MRTLQGCSISTMLKQHGAVALVAMLVLTGLPVFPVSALDGTPMAPPFNGNFSGYVTTDATADDVNRCAVDPVNDIANLLIADPNYVLAYHSGASSSSVWAPTFSPPWFGHGDEHRQGIQRLNRNSKNYLLVSNSVGYPDIPGFEVIELGSREGTREALGGNAQPQGWPSDHDRIVHYAEAFDPETEFSDNPLYQWVLLPGTNQGSWQIVGYTRHWNHAGGLQVMGRFVLVPLEHIGNDSTAGFRIADLSDPVSPMWGAVHSKQRVALPDAGAAELTRLNDGKYMVMVFGNDSDNVEVFVSSQASMPEFGLPSSTWESKASTNTPSNFGGYQGLQFITKCDGTLYLLGTHHPGDEDWADLWRVTFPNAANTSASSQYLPVFTNVGNAHLVCRSVHTGGQYYCDFRAGTGAYVSGTGRVLVYGVEHFNGAVDGSDAVVAVREFPLEIGTGWGYVWADAPPTASYTPNLTRQFNSTEAVNTITRTGTGAYTVHFPGLDAHGGTVLVTAYGGGSETCKVASWGPSDANAAVSIRCFSSSGAPVDASFTTSFVHPNPNDISKPMAYVWANAPTAPSYTPDLTRQFNSTGAVNTITRTGTGSYIVRLPGLGAWAGHAQVTAYGSGSERCRVGSMAPDGADQEVWINCVNKIGGAVDSQFVMTYVRDTSLVGFDFNDPGKQGFYPITGYALAHEPATASYTPRLNYQYNTTGGTTTITRLGVGEYQVNFPDQALERGHVQVTAYGWYGSGGKHCKVKYWTPDDGVRVQCYNATGAPADSYFTVTFLDQVMRVDPVY